MINIADIILVTLARWFFYILRKLPYSLKLPLAKGLVRIVLKTLSRSKYVSYRNLSLCFPGSTKEFKDKIWSGMLDTLARNLIGFSEGPTLTKEIIEKTLDTSKCKEVVTEIINNKGTGILLLIPHFGLFELLAHYWCLYDKPYAVLSRGFGFKRLDKWWNNQRELHGNVIFERKGGFKNIIQHLNKGTNVAILFDQNTKLAHSMFVDFFGLKASTTKSIGLASLKTSCKIVFATMLPSKEGKCELIAHWVKPPSQREGDHNQKIHDTILDAHKLLENYVREYPEQWFWFHRRFKTQPKGIAEDWYDRKKYPEEI